MERRSSTDGGVGAEQEATWRGFLDALEQPDRIILEKACSEVNETGVTATVEHQLNHATGKAHFVQQVVEKMTELDGVGRLQGRMQDVTARREAQDQVQYLESFDTLTQLPNRQFLRKRLQRLMRRCERSGESIAVLSLDLDRFERVNRELGFSAGDQLLQGVADRLTESTRATDFIGRGMETPDVSRLGGDEFTIVLTGGSAAEVARPAARRILHAFQEPFQVGGHSISMTASMGVASFPGDAGEADELLGRAHAAMQRAKKDGGALCRFFDRVADETARHQIAIESEIGDALERNEFVLEYQPQVDAQSLEVVGVEALIRWEHPTRGRVPPVEFIPVAEQSGQIGPLGEWVLRESCRQLKEWDNSGFPHMRMSVNVSSNQFAMGGLDQLVQRVLDETGLEPTRLELEMTETALLSDTEEVEEVCQKIHALGVGLSLDDFGTGYSSLSHLVRFQIDSLKIDRSFVERIQPGDVASGVTGAVIAMAARLGIIVIAEGVETEMQVDFLRSEGCDFLQGFRLGRPMSPAALADWLRQHA